MENADSNEVKPLPETHNYNKKTQNAWAFYDWANSVYPLVITTAIFPIFYDSHVVEFTKDVQGEVVNYVNFFGFEMVNTAVVAIVSAIYFLLICLFIPLLSGIADYSGSKKNYLRFFCYFGSVSCAALYFFNIEYLEISMCIFALAGIGFWSSLVFYNAYLPEVAPEQEHDRLSAKGFSMGYVGSVILLILCLVIVMTRETGPEKIEAMKICFVLTGIWWFAFSHVTYRRLPGRTEKKKKQKGIIWKGFQELKSVFSQIKKTKRLKRYLSAFFVYSMAVQTIMLMAVYFGQKEIDWPKSADGSDGSKTGLIIAVLLIQLIAVPGAIGLSRISDRIGNIKALTLILIMWIMICLSAFIVSTPLHFYIIAGLVGLVMGGIQSLSRSTYSKFLPKTKDTSSFFSFFDVAEKLGIVIGMASYGLIEQWTGSMKNSIVALVVFFIIGLILLLRVPRQEVTLN
ncbi:MAG: MFS transporter [Crocinitomicaceae bacterium]|jgi:MFS transporter, UMF1 family|nr:MFS transporter [Crocinitomicaceae bacterium]MBT5401875.1 MFS transporter [Crocinitomicaceae bacterium]MBT6029972.1 MFS transporter [Crocinitomicaceae bacterium]MBT6514311.1 MFS transporter [Crocinitomicaceae bacterium]